MSIPSAGHGLRIHDVGKAQQQANQHAGYTDNRRCGEWLLPRKITRFAGHPVEGVAYRT
jgi:hypothetical protein